MTKAKQKAAERGAMQTFLRHAAAEWAVLVEGETPDFLLQRLDGTEVVGIDW